jgi:hypothetical protein
MRCLEKIREMSLAAACPEADSLIAIRPGGIGDRQLARSDGDAQRVAIEDCHRLS